MKKQEKEAREKDRKARAIKREQDEAEKSNELILIYPLITYEKEFWLQDNYADELAEFKEEIEIKKHEALDRAGGNLKKLVFDMKKECFDENCPEYFFDLEICEKNKKGEITKKSLKNERHPDLQLEIDMKNQVYDRLFKKLDAKLKAEREADDEEDDENDVDLRGDFIKQ